MKKILLLGLLFAFSLILSAQNDELTKFVPSDIDGFACANVKALSAFPKFKEAVDNNQDPQVVQFKNDLTQAGIDVYDAFSDAILFFNSKTKKGGAIIKTKIDEPTFSKMLDNRPQDTTPVKKTAIGGKTYYIFEKDNNKTALVYLKPNIIGVSDQPDEVARFSSLTDKDNVTSNSKLMGYAAKADKKSPLWVVFEVDIKLPAQNNADQNNPAQQLFPFDNIQGGYFSLNFSGETNDTVNLNLHLNCKEQQKAQILTLQIQMMTAMAIPNISKGNQEIADQLSKALNFANEENDIVIKVQLTPSLQDELSKMAENNQLDFNNIQMQPPTAPKKKKAPKAAPAPGQ